MITITTAADLTASITGRTWTSDDATLAELLNLMADGREFYTSDPDPDHTLAREAVATFGGEITHHDRPEYVPGRIY